MMPKLPVQNPPLHPAFAGFAQMQNVIVRPPKIDRNSLLQLLQQGMNLQREGKFLDAERYYQTVLASVPEMPEANNLMGTIAIEAKDYSVAVEYFEKAIKGRPRDPFIRHNMASALILLHDYHDAIPHLRRALDLKPGQIETVALVADCYNRMGRGKEALQFAIKALGMDDSYAVARVTYAEALLNLGKMDQAETFLKETIAKKIAVPNSYQSLAATRKYNAAAPELIAIREELANPEFTDDQRSHLHFAAAKISNDAKLYDDAMEHFKKAKAITAASYDSNRYEKRVDGFINLFNYLFLSVRKNFGDPSAKPVFIVGMPRSGTTLTEQIISSHPQVKGAGELSEVATIARSFGDNPRITNRFSEKLMKLTTEESSSAAQLYLKHIALYSHDAQRITDKMPHNFEYVGLIALLFPNATIIHCKRDAIDNCLSCYMNAFSNAHAYNSDLEKLGRYYRDYNRLMAHWHKVLPGRIFDSQYETLVGNQEEQSRKLIAHCGLDWDDACLNYTENERAVNTISRWQVRQPIYKSSMKRWRPYEKHLGPLITALGDLADLD